MEFDTFKLFFRKYIEPFMVIGVLIIMLFIYIEVRDGNELRTEISKNCGWEGEDYRCFCEKSEAIAIKAKMDNNFSFDVDEVEYVQVDR